MVMKREVLRAIKKLGRPTIREIGTEVGLTAPSVFHHMAQLKEEGLITWEKGKARTITLTPLGEDQFQTI